MKKPIWLLVLFAVLALGVYAPEVEAQSASAWHGIPASPGWGNGYARHVSNGYVGVNWRHASPYPMKWGTHPGWWGGTPVYPGVPRWSGPMHPGVWRPGPWGGPTIPVQGGAWVFVQGGCNCGTVVVQGAAGTRR